ncbi:sigma-70 family RNA polymerase sigma factor [Paenibacillus mesophilus]|uniref:RNA polymerase sigma factor n=1 Tax=Paenibacillus mesophilus TaxID=2582849 RepID=UPI00110F1374|nr:sigma-70 family RNA polymerase sigma factor [Paenibacillus mesophilus]TMV46593.1 sigma-70 family RNA polymerase sigma factor [Paenibacillus mesophilus]
MHKATDGELMRLIRGRDRDAFEQLYDRYVKLVYSFALKSVRSEQAAREIVQLVFMRLWTTEKGYNPDKGQFVNWLITVTRNMSIDYTRNQRKHEATIAIEPDQWVKIPDDSLNTPEANLNRIGMREQIRDAYRLLSDNQIKLIERVYWEGYTLSEIAQMNNEPLGTIKSRLHQCLKVLRKHLTLQEEET